MTDPRMPSAERQEMLEQLTNVNLRSVGMLKDALADRCVELLSWALAERDRANTAEAQCAELTIENLQLAVKAGMMADIPETELRARTAGRIAGVEDKLAVAETRAREAVARAERAEEELKQWREWDDAEADRRDPRASG
jgi:hypothetical protein